MARLMRHTRSAYNLNSQNNYSLKLSALNNAAWNSVPTNQPHQPGGTAGVSG
jgi:hypothetical protein